MKVFLATVTLHSFSAVHPVGEEDEMSVIRYAMLIDAWDRRNRDNPHAA